MGILKSTTIVSPVLTTMHYFKNILPEKKIKLKNDYLTIQNHLQKINKYIENRKILKAKIRIGEMFIDLCEIKKTIDCSFYKDIKNFENMFVSNINYPALFGRMSVKNEKVILLELKKIINNLEEKIEELEKYLLTFTA